MKQVTSICLVALLTLAASAQAFAGGQATEMNDQLSPLFLHADDSQDLSDEQMESWNSSTPLATSRSAFNLSKKMSFALSAQDDGGVTASASGSTEEKKNPGKALMLSAIFPGAGELYAGATLRSALFFAIEVGCWYGAVSYAQRGNDKTDEFEAFADDHWRESIYRTLEYQAAIDENARKGYQGTENDWNTLTWSEKIDYLPGNFTHELPDEREQQYYENVGKYLTQFGFGWDDESGDNPNTQYLWDGTSPRANLYVDMRYDANNLLDASSTFFSIIMVNHVVSALDAGFVVRNNNRKLASVEPEVSQIWHNDNPVTVAGLRVRF